MPVTSERSKCRRRPKGFVNLVDTLKRTLAELEEIVAGLLFQGVFLNRYRDSNMHIRSFSLQWLSKLTIMRPDMFLVDKYLKYLGWMMNDNAACVRMTSIAGLLVPFKAAKAASHTGRSADRSHALDVSAMENVVKKFLSRIVDCILDVDIVVQENAAELLLAILRAGFLEDCDDDNIWNQVNLRALDPATSPKVRRYALYFIMEQLESFEVDNAAAKNAILSEKVRSERLDSIAAW